LALRYASALLLYDSNLPGPLTFLQHNRVAQHDAVSKATARLNQLRTATVKSAAAEEGNALIESHESLPLEVHPVYVNYLRMQAAGIDPAVIRERMVRGVWCVAARQELFLTSVATGHAPCRPLTRRIPRLSIGHRPRWLSCKTQLAWSRMCPRHGTHCTCAEFCLATDLPVFRRGCLLTRCVVPAAAATWPHTGTRSTSI